MIVEKLDPADIVVEIGKATRGTWATATEIAEASDLSLKTVRKYIEGMERNGMIVSRERDRRDGTLGAVPIEYTLAAEWGGIRA